MEIDSREGKEDRGVVAQSTSNDESGSSTAKASPSQHQEDERRKHSLGNEVDMSPRARIVQSVALFCAAEASLAKRGDNPHQKLWVALYRRLHRAMRLLGGSEREAVMVLRSLPDLAFVRGLRTLRECWWFAVRALHATCVTMRRIRNAIVSITRATKKLVEALTGQRESGSDRASPSLPSWIDDAVRDRAKSTQHQMSLWADGAASP